MWRPTPRSRRGGDLQSEQLVRYCVFLLHLCFPVSVRLVAAGHLNVLARLDVADGIYPGDPVETRFLERQAQFQF